MFDMKLPAVAAATEGNIKLIDVTEWLFVAELSKLSYFFYKNFFHYYILK